MILYHERRATTQGDKRVEVQVEEVMTTKGPRYVVFAFLAPALSQPELKQEWLYSEREKAVRASLAWFDAQVKELFANVPEGQILPRGRQEAVTVSNRASTEPERIGDGMGQPPQPEKVEYVVQYETTSGIWCDESFYFSPQAADMETGRKYLIVARLKNKEVFGHEINDRLLKRTTCGDKVTEEVIDA